MLEPTDLTALLARRPPDPESVIAWVRRNPPPSGDYCPACLRAQIWHCGEPSRRGERHGCRQRIKAPFSLRRFLRAIQKGAGET